MRVAIIGTGGIGRGYAAYLTTQGHEPVLWSPSGVALGDFAGGATLDVTGKLETSLPLTVAPDCAQAVNGADAVIIAVQANGFRAVIDALAPHLAAHQTVIISAHCSFAALYLRRLIVARGLDPMAPETSFTSPNQLSFKTVRPGPRHELNGVEGRDRD